MIKRFLITLSIFLFIIFICGENKQNPENQTNKSESGENKGDLESFVGNLEKLSESFNEGKKV
ncbi:MAG: hypothetical protein ACUVQP_10775 [Bacteroidales bacterium]